MKKQTLFDLTSMPKLILSVTLIVMTGALFGIIGYLAKTSKIDLPIANPVIETQCEVDSDCELVYTGPNACPPCDFSVKDYRCLNKDEAKKIEENRIRAMCKSKPCAVEFDRYTCKCENGKCEKVKIELVEEVIITTDKTEYEQGEMIKITIENNSDKEQKVSYPPYIIEEFKNNNWIEIKQIWCPCGVFCEEVEWLFIKSEDELEYEWNQQKSWCNDLEFLTYPETISAQVSIGKYRIKSIKIGFPDSENHETIYSNEFTIKEKSALDARCGEKVKFDSPCYLSRIIEGYEFDPVLNKCKEITVYGGCSFETPFESLEECQEVCEKKENDVSNWQTYRNEELGFEFKYPEDLLIWRQMSKIHLVAVSFSLKDDKTISSEKPREPIFTVYLFSKEAWEETQSWEEKYRSEKIKEDDKGNVIACRINIDEYSEIINQILSTLKFIKE